MRAVKIILTLLVVFVFMIPAKLMAASYKMRLTHQMPETHFLAGEIKDFKSLVEEKTGGKVIVEVYPAAQAFKPKQVINAVVTGAIEAGMVTNFQWSGIIPVMDVFIVPFLITKLPVIDKVINGKVGEILFNKMEAKGVIPLMWLLQCRTNIYTSNEKLLIWPADFKGKKIRGTSKIMNIGSEGLGGSTMPISGPEVYSALQRGTLDVGLTGIGAALARHYYEVQKYGTVTNNFTVVHIVFVNPKFWKSLSPNLKNIIKECAIKVQNKSLKDSERSKENAIKKLKKKMTIHIQTKEEEKAWQKAMAIPVLDFFLKKTGKEGKELVDLIKKLKQQN